VNDLHREVNKKKTPLKKTPANPSLMFGNNKAVVNFRSPAIFPENVFDSAEMLHHMLYSETDHSVLVGRRVAVRYTDSNVDGGNSKYYADGIVTKTKLLKTMVKVSVVLWIIWSSHSRPTPSVPHRSQFCSTKTSLCRSTITPSAAPIPTLCTASGSTVRVSSAHCSLGNALLPWCRGAVCPCIGCRPPSGCTCVGRPGMRT
jgi:hypothetical protein